MFRLPTFLGQGSGLIGGPTGYQCGAVSSSTLQAGTILEAKVTRWTTWLLPSLVAKPKTGSPHSSRRLSGVTTDGWLLSFTDSRHEAWWAYCPRGGEVDVAYLRRTHVDWQPGREIGQGDGRGSRSVDEAGPPGI